jgi:hypothetical protein
MNARFHVKTRALWLFGAALVLVGGLLVLQLVALLVWQYSVALETRAWPRLPLVFVFSDHSQLSAATARFLPVIPEFPWSWLRDSENGSSVMHVLATWLLDKVHIGLVPALLGVAIMIIGGIIAIRQKDMLGAAKRHDEDRRRRVREYRKAQQDLTVDRWIIGDQTDLIETADKRLASETGESPARVTATKYSADWNAKRRP